MLRKLAIKFSITVDESAIWKVRKDGKTMFLDPFMLFSF